MFTWSPGEEAHLLPSRPWMAAWVTCPVLRSASSTWLCQRERLDGLFMSSVSALRGISPTQFVLHLRMRMCTQKNTPTNMIYY